MHYSLTDSDHFQSVRLETLKCIINQKGHISQVGNHYNAIRFLERLETLKIKLPESPDLPPLLLPLLEWVAIILNISRIFSLNISLSVFTEYIPQQFHAFSCTFIFGAYKFPLFPSGPWNGKLIRRNENQRRMTHNQSQTIKGRTFNLIGQSRNKTKQKQTKNPG